ncbi:MAG: AsnC family transcriptional regulator [Thermodesulfobacteriota bacterium]|nr:AsnC family transcriptional regulator [Thermodesulfobacteriota bacterium]
MKRRMKKNVREKALFKGTGEKGKHVLDQTDRIILNEIQRNFPVTHRPFLSLARKLQIKEKEILARVQRLKEVGIIRRIGASFSASAVGFTSTLCAAKVPKNKIGGFVAVVNTYPGVTHNYERGGDYNIWFTLIAPSRKKIDKILSEISENTGVKEILNLPALKTFKIAVDFNFE